MINKETLTEAFNKKDRKKLWIPKAVLEDENIKDKEVIAWMHKSGHLGYMVLNDKDGLKGIVLDRGSLEKNGHVAMCDLCCSVYSSAKIAMFTFKKSKEVTVGTRICSDLKCEDRIRSSETNNVHSMRETLSRDEKILRYYVNAIDFVNRNMTP